MVETSLNLWSQIGVTITLSQHSRESQCNGLSFSLISTIFFRFTKCFWAGRLLSPFWDKSSMHRLGKFSTIDADNVVRPVRAADSSCKLGNQRWSGGRGLIYVRSRYKYCRFRRPALFSAFRSEIWLSFSESEIRLAKFQK